MDVGQREVAEDEAHAVARALLDQLDLAKGRAREGTLVVAVLDQSASARRSAGVIDAVIDRRDHPRRRRYMLGGSSRSSGAAFGRSRDRRAALSAPWL